MSEKVLGELVPVGGGDPIPLLAPQLSIGRRESCDICLQYTNISGRHCELAYVDGIWAVKDLGSTNGIKVNGNKVMNRRLRPGDELAIGQRKYKIEYTPEASAEALDSIADEAEDLSISLMEKAGLSRRRSE